MKKLPPLIAALLSATFLAQPILAQPIGEVDTVFNWIGPDHKIVVDAHDDPKVGGVTCYVSRAKTGGIKGGLGLAEDKSEAAIECRQIGPIKFKQKFEQGEDVFRTRRSLFFKKMQIVRGCDVKRNVLVYMVYSDRLIEGSPKNSTSSVPIMPWGAQADVPKCADYVAK